MKTLAAFALCMAVASFAPAQQRVTPNGSTQDPKTAEDFSTRVQKYVSVRDKAAGNSKPTDSADELKKKQAEMAAKIREQRANAKHGDVFDEDVTEMFKRELRANFKGANGKRIRLSMAHAEPLPKLSLKVNDSYPDQVPLQSTPPTLLQTLPRLPKGMEYRFVGRDLILYDSASGLIVDFIHEALPNY